MKKTRRVIVVGGGIAGPALALFLARNGLEPSVFEAYPRDDDVGGAFQIAPNGLRVLESLGLAEGLMKLGNQSSCFTFRNHHGRIIGNARTDKAGPALNIGRASIQRALRSELERIGIPTYYQKRLRDIALDGSGVIAHFEDGSSEVGDVLVGADGTHSRVRALILPEQAKPRDTGMVSIGGFCKLDVTPPPDPEDANRLNFIVGPSHQFGYSMMGSSRWGFWCHASGESEADRKALLADAPEALRDRLLDRYAGWCAPTRDLISSVDVWLRTPIHDVPSLPTWHRSRVVLMGDAAHAMSPAGGQGASMALEDAMVLSSVLSVDDRSVDESFAVFDRLRRKRAEAMVAQGYQNDRRSLKELGPVGMWMRDNLLFPVIAPVMERGLNRLYSEPVRTGEG